MNERVANSSKKHRLYALLNGINALYKSVHMGMCTLTVKNVYYMCVNPRVVGLALPFLTPGVYSFHFLCCTNC
jgi:hypothetical protein